MKFPIPDAALDDRLAILGTAGSGKTYLATTAMERLLRIGARLVAIDPLGVMWGLRLEANGSTPSPFDLPIFGGAHGDLPLTENAGALIGETVATIRESCIVDLSELPTKAAERRFMTAFLEAIYRHTDRSTDPYHLIIDEADRFAPQKPPKGDETMLNRMEEIVRRGRVRGFIPWLITQRPAVLNKNVLSQADGLVMLKLTSSQDREQVGAWIEGQADRAAGKAILGSLPTMQRGQGVVWIPGRAILETVQFPRKTTFDSSSAPKRGERATTKTLKALDLGKLRDRLAKVEAETKENDPRALKAKVAELERQLKQQPKAAPDETGALKDREAAFAAGARQGRESAYPEGWRDGDKSGFSAGVAAAVNMLKQSIGSIAGVIYTPGEPPKRIPKSDVKYTEPMQAPRAPVVQRSESRVSTAKMTGSSPAGRSNGDASLAQGARKILVAIAQHPDGLSAEGITVIVGYRATSRREYLRQLKSAGFVAGSDAAYFATESGLAMLGDFEPLPIGDDLRRYWQSNLSGGELTLFNAIYERGAISLPELQEATGYKATSTREYLRQLRARKLVSGASDAIQLSERLS